MAGDDGRVVRGGRWAYDPHDETFRGGHKSRVFAGTDLRTGNQVVVKTFSGALGERAHHRFLREAELHRDLKHDAILKLLDKGTDDLGDYIVTRRLEPGALWDVLEAEERLSAGATLAIGRRIAGALEYMHGQEQIHGDLSPGNVLLDGNVAYLADLASASRSRSCRWQAAATSRVPTASALPACGTSAPSKTTSTASPPCSGSA